jgi:tetratricopeptide (TPR) repeat protein
LKKYRESLNDYNKYLQKYPENCDALDNRAIILLFLERNEEALREFQFITELYPDYYMGFHHKVIF